MRGLASSAPDTIRTYDLGFRKALLYPAELRGRAAGKMAREPWPFKIPDESADPGYAKR